MGKTPKHIVTLSFDDGFAKSTRQTAEIYEKHGLKACFNVLSVAHLPIMSTLNPGFNPGLFADFGLLNEMVDGGHEVAPHGYAHFNKAKMPLEEAKASILKCLEVFDRELKGFDRKKTVFNFPYNASTPALEAWLPTEVRALRALGVAHGINPMPTRETVILRTTGFGPGNTDAHLEECVAELFKRDSGWLVYCAHGLDGEGWGPMGSEFLDGLLGRLVKMPGVAVWPAAQTFAHLGLN